MSSLETRLDKLLDLLILRPTPNELLKSIETDILSIFNISNVTIFTLDSHNNAKKLFSNSPVENAGESVDFQSVLKLLSPNSNLTTLTDSTPAKSSSNDFLILPISNGKCLKGYILLNMACENLTDQDLFTIEIMGKISAVYLMIELNELKNTHLTKELSSQVQFSARQLQILQGFVEGKTNHELAEDLGFSVSTVRHETMEIYRLLGASDRKEAAKIAQEKDIV